MTEAPVSRLHRTLMAAGITCTGVSGTALGNVRLSGVPVSQQAQAMTVVTAFDWRPRRPRPLAAVVADIEAWIGVDVVRLRHAAALALAGTIVARPGYARAQGVPVDDDEVTP